MLYVTADPVLSSARVGGIDILVLRGYHRLDGRFLTTSRRWMCGKDLLAEEIDLSVD